MCYGAAMHAPFTLQEVESFRQEIKRSRFLAIAGPVVSEDDAKAFIAEHADASASHNCWAWRIGQQYRFSDDGEPGGTAGKPILQAMDGQSLDKIAVVVIRWFGGVLLGSGGLMRAYGGTAAACLRAADKIPIVETVEAMIACNFADLALVQSRLSGLPAVQVLGQRYDATGGELAVRIHASELDLVRRMIADLTSGRATISH